MYDRTLNRPDSVSTSASPPSTTVTRKATRRMDVCIPAIDRMVWIAPRPGSMAVRRSSSAWRACSGSPRTRSVSDVPGFSGPVGKYTPRNANRSGNWRPSPISRTTPTTVNVRDDRDGAAGEPDCGDSRRTTCPTASRFGQSWRARVSDTTHHARLRGAFRLREAAPSHDIDVEHIEVFRRHGHLVDRHCSTSPLARPLSTRRRRRFCDGTQSAATTLLLPPPTDEPSRPGAARRAVARWRSRPSPCRSSARRDPRSRRPGHLAEKWRRRLRGGPMRRPGRRSGPVVRGPGARPSSARRASSAPVRGVWPAAPARARRTPSRQRRQPPGTAARASPRQRARTGRCPSRGAPAALWWSPRRAHLARNSRETARPHAAAASARRRLSVSSCRTMRRRDAPSDSRMPISRWRETPRASSRLATLAQPIIRISPKAKKIGEKTISPWSTSGREGALRSVSA